MKSHVFYIVELHKVSMPTKMGNTHKSTDKIFGTMVFASLGEGMQGKTSVALGKVFRQVTARGYPDGGSNTRPPHCLPRLVTHANL